MDKAQALATQMASGAKVVSLDQLNAGNTAVTALKSLLSHE